MSTSKNYEKTTPKTVCIINMGLNTCVLPGLLLCLTWDKLRIMEPNSCYSSHDVDYRSIPPLLYPLILNSWPPDTTSDLPLTLCYLIDNRLRANTFRVKHKQLDLWTQTQPENYSWLLMKKRSRCLSSGVYAWTWFGAYTGVCVYVCVCVIARVTGREMVKDRGKNSLWWPSWCLAKHTEEDTCTI